MDGPLQFTIDIIQNIFYNYFHFKVASYSAVDLDIHTFFWQLATTFAADRFLDSLLKNGTVLYLVLIIQFFAYIKKYRLHA